MPNPYDQACRFLLRRFARPLLAWLLGLPENDLNFDGWLDTRGLPWPGQPDRTCDTVASLRDGARGGLPWAVPVEFQVDPDPLMFGRGLGYLGGLWCEAKPAPHPGDRFEVGLVVVNLRGRGRCSRLMRLAGSRLATALRVVERNLSRVRADRMLARIEGGRAPAAALPWFPLFRGAGEAGIISRWAGLAHGQTDAELRRAMPLAAYFAEAAGRADSYREALEGWDAMESQVFNEWTELAQLRARREERAESLLRVLRKRPELGLPSDLERSVRAVTDLGQLAAALDEAVTSPSLEEFRQKTGL